MIRQKKGAMEMSIGTIVIIVLAMSMLVLGIVLIRNIFTSAGGAVSSIDSGVKSEIQKVFSTEGKKVAVYPTSRMIELSQGNKGEGFAFSVKNLGTESADFTWTVEAEETYSGYTTKCSSSFSADKANDFIDINTGTFSLEPSTSLDNEIIVTFTIPADAPICTIPYKLIVEKGGADYSTTTINVVVKA